MEVKNLIKNGFDSKKACLTAIMAFLALSIILAPMPIANAAAAIKLTASVQASGTSITVSGTGFGANQPVGIAFGAEVDVIEEEIAESGPYDVDIGPYTYQLSQVPVKPGTYRKALNLSTTLFVTVDIDNGNGTFSSPFAGALVNGTINYVTGLITGYYYTALASTTHYINLANYTHYEYDVTPPAGVFADPSGSFLASITVPSVGDGVYAVTAIDTKGNIATTTLTIANSGTDWTRTYGGIGDDSGIGDTVQTSDGGYAIFGNTSSFGAGGSDFYLVKTDADGDRIWSKTYGGVLNEGAGSMCLTSDGGFALCGGTESYGYGGFDFWLVKTNSHGDVQWSCTYGGADTDYAMDLIQTSDGGYAVVGPTTSFGAGNIDAWLVKTDANGNMQWNRTYGGAELDRPWVIQASGGGYAIGGVTNSSGAGDNDVWLVKTDANGNMQWNKTYGGTELDAAYSLVVTLDGGYALGGYTTSFGAYRTYLVKTDASGNMQWNQTYFITGLDIGIVAIQTMDGGYAIAGWNYRNNQDYILIKTDAAGNMQWQESYGGRLLDNCYALLQASDGGYVLTGNTQSFGLGGIDIWLVKTNAAGVVPESLPLVVMLLLSTIAVIVSMRYYRKQPKWQSR